MSRRCRSLLLAAVVLWLVPCPAFASFHLMRIVEVFPGTAEQPDAQYITLQMYSGFQNFVAGHTITVFDANGASLATFTFASDVANSANQSTILIATPSAQTLFGVTADLTMTPVISPGGGKVCYETIDCVSWGSFSGGNTLPSPSGTPFNAPAGLVFGMAMRRNLGIDGNPATLSPSDDTNDSAHDFLFATPAPKNNAGQTGSLPTSETPTPTTAPETTATPTPTLTSETPTPTPTTVPETTATPTPTPTSETPTPTPTTAPETTATPTPTSTPPCVGDCNGSNDVTVDELLTMVNIALGNADASTCLAGDGNNSMDITIDEILTAVNNALSGCPKG